MNGFSSQICGDAGQMTIFIPRGLKSLWDME